MSLKLKTILGVALIEAALLSVLIITVANYMRDSAGSAIIKRAQTTATLFATTAKDPVISFDLASLESFSDELLTNPDLVYVRVVDARGRVFAEAGDENALARVFDQDMTLDSVTDGILDYSADIAEGGEIYGRVELGIDTESVQSVIAASKRLSITIAGIEMILVALFSYLLGSYLTRHLDVLRRSARKIASGDYSVLIPINSNDELAEVSRAFNKMSSAIGEYIEQRDQKDAELREINQSLEDRVARRTEKIRKQVLELQAANEKIEDTQKKLVQSEKLASIGQLAAGVAHEINNPVGFVRSNLNSLAEYMEVYDQLLSLYAEVVERNNIVDSTVKEIREIEEQEDLSFIGEDVDELIKESIEGTTRIRKIVQGLSEFSRISDVGKVPCNLNDCIETAVKMVQNELKGKCEIRKDLGDIALVEADSGEIGQVLLNLLINAGHAIDQLGVIEIKSCSDESLVRISVTDNGSGINEKHIDKLFDPFFTTKPVGEGTGLGLSISFGIVRDHQGEIRVDSQVGKGTTFTLEFPVCRDGLVKAA